LRAMLPKAAFEPSMFWKFQLADDAGRRRAAAEGQSLPGGTSSAPVDDILLARAWQHAAKCCPPEATPQTKSVYQPEVIAANCRAHSPRKFRCWPPRSLRPPCSNRSRIDSLNHRL
jgi:hypothetical protein